MANQGEMGVLLARHGRLLREYARHYLGAQASDDEVEDTIERTVDALLAAEDFSHPHGLRHATLQLWRECQRTLHEQTNASDVPVDRLVGPINTQARRILERLGPRSREAILRAAAGWSPEQQAAADHTTVGTINIRLHRARRRFLQLKSELGSSAGAVVLALRHRFRAALGRRIHSVGADGVTAQLMATAGLVPLVAVSIMGPASQFPSTLPATHHRAALAVGAPPAAGREPVRMVPAANASLLGHSTEEPGPGLVRSTSPSLLGLTVRGAAVETPADLQLTAVATLPGTQSSVLVAVGTGGACSCRVLTQSLDGGTTWTATDGPPPDAKELALPPSYPSDPRIFAGVDPIEGQAPYEAAAFGQPFLRLTGLPPGRVAVSAHFDDGDPRLFSAGLTGLWSINPSDGTPFTPHEEVDYSQGAALQSTVGALATPTPSPDGPALLAWVPELATVPGSVGQPPLGPAIVRCPVASPCITASTLSEPPGRLATAGAVVVAYGGRGAYISRDLGASFNSLPIPDDVGALLSFVFVGPVHDPWFSATLVGGGAGIFKLLSTGWYDATGGERLLRTHGGDLAAISQGRVIDAMVGVGYRCTTATALRWLPRCP